MTNAALYSDQIIPANARIDLRLAEMMVRGEGLIGYVPCGPDPDRDFFNDRKAYYAQCGFSLVLSQKFLIERKCRKIFSIMDLQIA